MSLRVHTSRHNYPSVIAFYCLAHYLYPSSPASGRVCGAPAREICIISLLRQKAGPIPRARSVTHRAGRIPQKSKQIARYQKSRPGNSQLITRRACARTRAKTDLARTRAQICGSLRRWLVEARNLFFFSFNAPVVRVVAADERRKEREKKTSESLLIGGSCPRGENEVG